MTDAMKLTEWRQTLQSWLTETTAKTSSGTDRRQSFEKKGNNIWLQMIGNFLSSLSIFYDILPSLALYWSMNRMLSAPYSMLLLLHIAARWIQNVVKLSFVNLSIFRLLSVFLMSFHSICFTVYYCTVTVPCQAMWFAHNLWMNQIYQWKVSVCCMVVVAKKNKSLERDGKRMVYFLLDDHFPFNVVHLLLSLLSW